MNTTLPTARDLFFGAQGVDRNHACVIQASEADKPCTYDDFYHLVDSFQKFYTEKGLKSGASIMMLSPNKVQLAASVIAAWRLQMLAIPVDFRMTAQEAANVANSIDVNLLFASKQFADLEKLKSQLGDKCNRLHILEDEVQKADSASQEINLDFDALMILTSGTTGTPKGAVHDMHSLIENLKELGQLANLDSTVVCLLPLPLSHIFGLEVLCACVMFGATVVFCELEPSKFLSAINTFKPQILAGVPLMYGSLLAAPEGAVDLERTRILLCGGAPLPVSLAEQFEAKFHKRLNNGYGSTESKIIALNLNGPVESIGKPVPSVTVKIINENGELLEEGKEGEIIIDSPNLMKGYLGLPEKTKEVLTEAGYRTGDIGYVKDGYVYISGRAKEMIVVAGNKVFPQEVEEVLLRNPAVKEVAVTGPEHRRLGQIVKATIVIQDAELSKRLTASEEERKAAREEILKDLKQFCQDNLKRELRPMEWELRPANEPLPKTRSGKVDKKAL